MDKCHHMGCSRYSRRTRTRTHTCFLIGSTNPWATSLRIVWIELHSGQATVRRKVHWRPEPWPGLVMLNGHKSPWHVPKPKLAGSLVCQLAHLMPDSSRVNWMEHTQTLTRSQTGGEQFHHCPARSEPCVLQAGCWWNGAWPTNGYWAIC